MQNLTQQKSCFDDSLAKGAIFANVGKITPRGNLSGLESSSEEFVRARDRGFEGDYGNDLVEEQELVEVDSPSKFIPVEQIEVNDGNSKASFVDSNDNKQVSWFLKVLVTLAAFAIVAGLVAQLMLAPAITNLQGGAGEN